MNWIGYLIVFQYTILLLQARPETSTSSSSSEKITLEMEHPASVSAIITTLENSVPAEFTGAELKKHLSAAVGIPEQPINRASPGPQIKKNDPTKKTTKTPELDTLSTIPSDMELISKTTRYNNVDNHTHNMVHAKYLTANNVFEELNYAKSHLPLLNNPSILKQLRQQEINRINQQYLTNVYTYNPYLTQLLTTPKTVQTFFATAPVQTPIPVSVPVSQATYYLVNPDEIGTLDTIQTNEQFLNIENTFNPHYVSTDTYQVPRPPTVNIPYHEFPSTAPPLLLESSNITKLYSIIGSSTPDPFVDFHSSATKPSRRKVVKFSVTTHRSVKYSSNKYGSHHQNHKKKNSNKNQNNHKYHNLENQENHIYSQSNFHTHNTNSNKFPNKQTVGNQISVVYNESSQIINNTPLTNSINLNTTELNNEKNNTIPETTTKECLVTKKSENPQFENVCSSNDLKIIIKFDGTTVPNATDRSVIESKPKKIKTTTSAPVTEDSSDESDYDSLDYESNDLDDYNDDDESEELGFLSPIRDLLGLGRAPAGNRRRRQRIRQRRRRQRKRKRGKRKKFKDKDKKKHGNKGDDPNEIINKYQTIILQSPPPPTTTTAEPEKHKFHLSKSSFYKLLALIPILSIAKPILFGIWTVVLSPILVITIGGIALGVILYPFLAISRKQIYYASTRRSPRIVVHRHPTTRFASKAPSSGIRIAKWRSNERRRVHAPRNPMQRRKMFNNNFHQKRTIPIRYTNLQRSGRRTRDTEFQQWLMIQNNFNIRIMSPEHDFDYK